MLPSTPPPRKAKISLSDYPFRRDIETRLFMSRLTITEVVVLREILHHSLKISISQLAHEIDLPLKELLPILGKLSITKLFKRQEMILIVDKEMRKYFESKIEKFDSDFQPDFDFLQSILNKVPIHILPLWYAIPRFSDHIFGSIIEKYLLTPKIYRQYLHELQFDHPIFKKIIEEVFKPPHFKVTVADLMSQFDLSHEEIHEYLLLLEYHFVCCLSYQCIEDRWQEIVTPFSEWREYLEFEFQTKPSHHKLPIHKHQQVEFQFIKDLNTLLQACQAKKVLLKNVKGLHASQTFEHQKIIHKLIQLEFAKQSTTEHLIATEKGKNWLTKSLSEQVAILANDPLNTITEWSQFSALWNARNLRLVEKSLKRLIPYEWVEIKDFLRGFIAPIGNTEPVSLKNKGKKWKYVLPIYSSEEVQFIQCVILERLAELGVVETGTLNECSYFCLTSFGSHFIH